MSATDEIQVVAIQELPDYICSKRERNPAVVFSPALHILVRVRPQKIAEQT
jgi:hypothetical protein